LPGFHPTPKNLRNKNLISASRQAAALDILEYALRGDTSHIYLQRGKIMKNFAWAAVCLGFALCSGSAEAQQAVAPASGPVANPVTTMVKSQLPRFQKNMVGAAELMPPDKYSFKATPESASFGHMVAHSLQANYGLCSKISGTAAPEVKLTDADSKDKLVAGLKESFEFCTTALANADDSKLSDPMSAGPFQTSRAGVLILLSDEWFDHYAALATGLRLNGILPPSAQPKK
jgi:DinB superfamily